MHSQPEGFFHNLPLSTAMWLKYAVASKITASAGMFGEGLKVWQVFWLSAICCLPSHHISSSLPYSMNFDICFAVLETSRANALQL